MSRQSLFTAIVAVGALWLASCSGLLPDAGSSESSSGMPNTAESLSVAGQQLSDAVTGEALQETLLEIEQLTMAADGNRGPGSAGYLASAEWIEQQLTATGFYQVYRQEFTIQLDRPGGSRLADESGEVIHQRPLRFSPGTPDQGVTGRVVEPVSGNGCQVSDWGQAVQGQIALVGRGGCEFAELNQAAGQAGAVLVLVINNTSGGLYGTLDRARADDIPMSGITSQAGRDLQERLRDGDVQLTYRFEQHIDEYQTFNLFAETIGGRGDNVVMAGAHLDGVEEGPGINDNGSGSAILLATALRMADGDQPANKVRYAWWSGEEWGLLGAIHWVNGKVADDPESLTSLAAYINIDMVASPNYVIGVYDGDGSTFPGEDLTDGSDQVEQLFTGYLDAIGQPWVDSEMDGASDHGAFMNSGVPLGGLFTGAGDPKSAAEAELFGGQAGRDYDSNYHGSADSYANLSTDALVINGKAAAFVIGALAADSSAVNGSGAGNLGTPTPAEGYGYAAAF